MSPSCAFGLSKVGFASDLPVGTNTPSPFNVIRNLTAATPASASDASTTNNNDAILETANDVTLPRIDIRPSTGKGLGVFAVDPIPAYTPILEDHALLSLADGEDIPDLWQKYTALSPTEREDFHHLDFSANHARKEPTLTSTLQSRGHGPDQAKSMARVTSRFMSNAFKENDKWKATLFLTVARLNHSCTPNAQVHYRPARGAKLVYALHDIQPGEELTISYFDITMAHADRQHRAKSWDFVCACPVCAVEDPEYEGALAQLRAVLARSPRNSALTGQSETTLQEVTTAIGLALRPEYPWLVAALPNLCIELAGVCRARGLGEQERAALGRALEWEGKITGVGSPFCAVKREYIRSLDGRDGGG